MKILKLATTLVAWGAILLTNAVLSGQTVQTIEFDAGFQDIARSVTTDAQGDLYLGGLSEDRVNDQDFIVLKYDRAGSLLWERRIDPATGFTGGSVNEIATDPLGNVYAVGTLSRVLPDSQTQSEWAVVSYDSIGNLRWINSMLRPGSRTSVPFVATIDPAEGVYVSGIDGVDFETHWLTVKYTFSGNLAWEAALEGSSAGRDFPVASKIAPDGSLVVAGSTSNQGLNLGSDSTVAKYSPSGVEIWRRDFSFTDISDERFGDMDIDSNGNVYLTGDHVPSSNPELAFTPFTVAYSSGGDFRFAVIGDGLGGSGIAIDSADNLIVSGQSTSGSGNELVTAVSKLDSNGSMLWSRDVEYHGKVNIDVDDSIVISGDDFGSFGLSCFFTKLSSNGGLITETILPETGQATDSHLDDFGILYITSRAKNTVASFKQDMVTSKVSFDGGGIPPPPPAGVLPSDPVSLSLSAAKRQLSLRWTDTSNNEDGFVIERSTDGGAFQEVAEVGANADSFVDRGLHKKRSYTYRVRAFNESGSSGFSNTATASPR